MLTTMLLLIIQLGDRYFGGSLIVVELGSIMIIYCKSEERIRRHYALG